MENIAFNNLETWNHAAAQLPELDRYVLVFRYSNRKFMIARMSKLKTNPEDLEENKLPYICEECSWVTQYSNCHEIDEDDLWLTFPKVELIVQY